MPNGDAAKKQNNPYADDNVNHQINSFNHRAENYYSSRQNKLHLFYKNLLWSYIFAALPKREGSLTVLEPMCGYAEGKLIIEKHYNRSINYTGFDSSRVLVDLIKQKNPDCNITVQDATTFEPTQKYDLIFLTGGLHHIPDFTQPVLKNLLKGLNESGYFINFEPTYNNIIIKTIRSFIYKKSKIFDEKTERAFSINEINREYDQSGFMVYRQFHVGLFSYIMYNNPDAFPFSIKKTAMVSLLFKIDKLFYENIIGKIFSFATLTILRRK